tara:strand:+ start:122 stop:382 length:261 start_codon:yes stop_codon:yes gene_type:complete
VELIKITRELTDKESQKAQDIFSDFQKAKIKEKTFAKKLAIVTQIIDNLFRLQKNQPLISYLSFRRGKRKFIKLTKKLKNKKCIKR